MKTIKYIDPLEQLGGNLLTVEKPSRYTGGEFGCRAKKNGLLNTCIAFPDLYEIGMSNKAVRILYNCINDIDNISCDRVFAPAPDFELLLKNKNIPLYGLETGMALNDFDILLFTLGYELGITGVLSILESGNIPILSKERNDTHPIIILGGPCSSNPLPYAKFIDAFWIGEAEMNFFYLLSLLRDMKTNGEKKPDLLSFIASNDSVWTQGKEKAIRNIYWDFPQHQYQNTIFPVPNMRTVQQHGVVEIMRGCPNGCRFCHAGIWYRPMRQKSASLVQSEIEALITKGGFKEISLSSLSSGDYNGLEQLLDNINAKYAGKHISFQLPSLHISTFSLPVLKKISEVRKSGLTFAIETPLDSWQLTINKKISIDSIVDILNEAKKNGWRTAKFYFMIGLPVNLRDATQDEAAAIIKYIEELSRRTKLKFSINIGIFIPKPHTPFQRQAQMNEEDGREKLRTIQNALKKQGHKVSIHDTFVSLIEGLISRGDERMGNIIERAYRAGCRLDAWSEFFKKEIWRDIINSEKELFNDIYNEKNTSEPLPWDFIKSGTTKKFISKEFDKASLEVLTILCQEKCSDLCGVCNNANRIVENSIHNDINTSIPAGNIEKRTMEDQCAGVKDPKTYRILFSFCKEGRAVFISHLSLIEVFSMAAIRADIPVLYTKGFNPLPRLDFASPLSIGISAGNEIASIDTEIFFDGESFLQTMNKNLPQGIKIEKAKNFLIPSGVKKHSIASLLWGFQYESKTKMPEYVPVVQEKEYRLQQKKDGSIFELKRLNVLAEMPELNMKRSSYFDIYSALY